MNVYYAIFYLDLVCVPFQMETLNIEFSDLRFSLLCFRCLDTCKTNVLWLHLNFLLLFMHQQSTFRADLPPETDVILTSDAVWQHYLPDARPEIRSDPDLILYDIILCVFPISACCHVLPWTLTVNIKVERLLHSTPHSHRDASWPHNIIFSLPCIARWDLIRCRVNH